MVDFPEGYGFEPNGAKMLAQSEFYIEIGTYVWRGTPGREHKRMPPWQFRAIGYIANDKPAGSKLNGCLYRSDVRVTGTVQEIITVLCTAHRMSGDNK
jgi:hypothetical protein